jgi:hypothetical protein
MTPKDDPDDRALRQPRFRSTARRQETLEATRSRTRTGRDVTLTISLVVAATAVSLGNRSLLERPSAAAPAAPQLDHAQGR